MNNNTLEDLYKKAIKEKYEEVKNGDDFYFLNAPTRGKLNKLCWEKFANNDMHSNDLNVFNSLLGLSFDISAKKKFKQETDLFRPVEKFFKGETDPDKIDVVDMAAILVDFNPRPFNKFRKEIDPENLKLIEELRDTKHYKPEFSSVGFSNDADIEKLPSSKNEEEEKEKPYVPLPFITNDSYAFNRVGQENVKTTKSEVNFKEIDDVKRDQSKWNDPESQKSETKREKFFRRMRQLLFENFLKRLGKTAMITVLIFCSIGGVVYFAFFQKQCMQWSSDHYEKVSCDLEVNGLGSFNVVEPFDKTVFDLKKIKVCDTTPFFDKNGEAIVWYGKTANGIDFFNGHGRHPENNSSLKPVTRYILNKYVKK
ncbi:hypothetical protein [Flavobacterium sp. KACC 22763]|uniref:hypothetical protein n=1 Tax=Flavobacterium sp. KACC 22763 TaxID=3025668 RepID=UPI0023672209|nr:hypothetical protein [Flavobacterium sp. KACC 22763]WDF62345.1 hypothetical protein PQ463_11980 [Flavobacterium sp. KACC 22763]